ncbi:DivIVA domain-containing protein [Cellulomonas cellasea]|uniref:DivIVA domain-containing protein n=1 Tax=Cellulomonas cellasea TaxID=43670 RepID=UPI0025A4936A|nr:DivIVA domain-containing protein [Cellulomonas cellasea]MDM8085272.1 DivIVA domain-containing protein [Cellulomonas cellasea]
MITADQLRRRALSSSYRSDGYDQSQVDHYLELAAATLSALEEGRSGSSTAATMLLREMKTAKFGPRRSGAGYASSEVEALRTGVVAALEAYVGSTAPAAGAARPQAAAPAVHPTPTPTATPPAQPAPRPAAQPATSPTPGGYGAHGELGAFDLIMRVQSGRTTLMATRGERIVVQTASGALHAIESVEATPDGVVLNLA